ncbi:MAG: penicillin-binding protein 2 [Candidatus Omnitrophota bacterium]
MRRIAVLKTFFIILFVVLSADIFYLQIIRGRKFLEQSENNRIRLVPEEASRGVVFDRNGIALVDNKLVFDIVAIPQEILSLKNKDEIFYKLAKFLKLDAEILSETFKHNFQGSFFPVMLLSDVSKETAFLIEQERLQLPGILVKTRAVRHYKYGPAAAHILGYVGKIREEEYAALKNEGYSINDLKGRGGLEEVFDEQLRGKNGGMQIEVDSAGNIKGVFGYKCPQPGANLYTNIDINLQGFIYELVKDKKSAVGVMDADSGEILALVSTPAFDPNILIDKKKYVEIAEIFKNKDAPLLNRNLKTYPPGSIFKIVTAYSGLAENIINTESVFECPGEYKIGNYAKYCWLKRGHGALTIKNAIATSCNVFFYKLGLKIGEQNLYRYASLFGFGRKTQIELPEEEAGIVPDAKWKKANFNEKWFAGDTLNFAIGQGYLLISPLQALKMAALIANTGEDVLPHIVAQNQPKANNKRILSVFAVEVIREGMRRVVSAGYGTGHRAYVESIETCGKTGTAQVIRQRSHAWFVGYTKLGGKRICFVVFLENGGHGGEQAAQLMRQIIVYLHGQKGNFT